jgi:hypothetical protein
MMVPLPRSTIPGMTCRASMCMVSARNRRDRSWGQGRVDRLEGKEAAYLLRAVEGPRGGDGERAVEGVGRDGEEGRGARRGRGVVGGRFAGDVDEHLDGAEGEHALEGLAHGPGVGAVHPEREHLRLGLLRDLLRQLRQLLCTHTRQQEPLLASDPHGRRQEPAAARGPEEKGGR